MSLNADIYAPTEAGCYIHSSDEFVPVPNNNTHRVHLNWCTFVGSAQRHGTGEQCWIIKIMTTPNWQKAETWETLSLCALLFLALWNLDLKHQEKISSVFGGHIIKCKFSSAKGVVGVSFFEMPQCPTYFSFFPVIPVSIKGNKWKK